MPYDSGIDSYRYRLSGIFAKPTLDHVEILFSLFSDTPSVYIGGMWTRGRRLREEGAMGSQREEPASGQREGPLLARSI
jgi:hypothetical protein